MLDSVLFDMDGVIIDSEPLWRRAMIQVFNASGLPFTEADCRLTTGMRIDEVVTFWNQKTTFTNNEIQVKNKIEDVLCSLILSEGKAMEGLHHALKRIQAQKIKIAIATSSSQKIIRCVLDALKIDSFFEHIQSAEHLSHGKPHPEVFIRCAQTLSVAPTRCLVVEDSLNGVIAAKAACMKVVAIPDVPNKTNPKFCIADAILESLNDFTIEQFHLT
ncbi:MAG: hexitol phosphatase HxpB [Bacteroidetes bacterium]|nr:hexitol phosphatase HxpB [Bacteroidota bacterium]